MVPAVPDSHSKVLPHSRCEVLVRVSTKPIQTIPMCKTPSIYHTALLTKAAGKEGRGLSFSLDIKVSIFCTRATCLQPEQGFTREQALESLRSSRKYQEIKGQLH